MEKQTRKSRAQKALRDVTETFYPANRLEVIAKLKELGPFPNPDEVDKVMGDNSWTRLVCDECENIVDEGVQLGEAPSDESKTVLLCRSCLMAAVDLLSN